jgi:manganese efflux pump family protein
MNLSTTLLIAVGLSADATAVALCSGSLIRHLKLNKMLKIALFFGGFQAMMTLIGCLIGEAVVSMLASIDHWISFGLLAAVGGKMIHEAFADEEHEDEYDPLNTWTLTVMAIATSIDALAVGVSLVTVQSEILRASAIIGITTFGLSMQGVFVGHQFGNVLGRKIEIIGGIILIGIGLRILLGHVLQS